MHKLGVSWRCLLVQAGDGSTALVEMEIMREVMRPGMVD